MKYYLILISVMSVITLILYRLDKVKAKKNKRRIRETVLLFFGLFGGAAGALLGMYLFHHKIRRWYFWVINFLGLVIQTAIPIIFLI